MRKALGTIAVIAMLALGVQPGRAAIPESNPNELQWARQDLTSSGETSTLPVHRGIPLWVERLSYLYLSTDHRNPPEFQKEYLENYRDRAALRDLLLKRLYALYADLKTNPGTGPGLEPTLRHRINLLEAW